MGMMKEKSLGLMKNMFSGRPNVTVVQKNTPMLSRKITFEYEGISVTVYDRLYGFQIDFLHSGRSRGSIILDEFFTSKKTGKFVRKEERTIENKVSFINKIIESLKEVITALEDES